MHKPFACSILMVASALVACGKDKHQEPAMTPAAGDQWEQRQQTSAPPYMEEQQPQAPTEAQPGTQQPGTEWQSGQEPTTEQPAMSDPWATQPQTGNLDAQLLAEARCRREFRCGHVGENKKHATTEECQAMLLPQGDEALKSCPKGTNKEALTTCLTAIQSKGCESPMDTLTEYEQCRTTMLCAQ